MLDERFCGVFILGDKKSLEISMPYRLGEMGIWCDPNNSFDSVLKECALINSFKITFNKWDSFSFLNNIYQIYDKKNSNYLHKSIICSKQLLLVNTDKTTTDVLDKHHKNYMFLGYTAYCNRLLTMYLEDNTYDKVTTENVINDIIYDNDVLQHKINRELNFTKYHEELKPVYFEHLDMISQTKFLHIDTEHKYAFNMMVECMALKTIPVFDKDPLLIGLEEGTHYVLKDSYNNSETYEEIIENNTLYYEEHTTKNIMSNMFKYLLRI
jgi:hypothetical protein